MRKLKSSEPGLPRKLLTDVELEIMTILWRLRSATVHDVLGALPARRKLAYTSVSTMLRILEQKGAVISKPAAKGRGHIYEPTIVKAEYERHSLRDFVSRVFGGEPRALVQRLVETEGLTKEDLKELRAAIEARTGDGGRS